MPFVNVKLVKKQVSTEQSRQLIEGVADLIVDIMGRNRNTTIITIDYMDENQWAIGGKTLDQIQDARIVSFINIKVSKGTTNPDEMARMIKATKELTCKILGNCEEANYFIIDELNPEAWGFGDISMAERGRLSQS